MRRTGEPSGLTITARILPVLRAGLLRRAGDATRQPPPGLDGAGVWPTRRLAHRTTLGGLRLGRMFWCLHLTRRSSRARAVELAQLRERPIREIAQSLGISESCLRNGMSQADVDSGDKPGLTSDERRELAELRRDKRRLEMENEILKRAAAYFASENILPK
jgi:transposase